MDIRRVSAQPTAAERGVVDALLGPPRSAWDGGERESRASEFIALEKLDDLAVRALTEGDPDVDSAAGFP